MSETIVIPAKKRKRKNVINPHILQYIEMVEKDKIRTCTEQKQMVKQVREVLENEDVYTDSAQLENYIKFTRYFPFKQLYPWEEFLLALFLCTYNKDDNSPRWSDLFCLIGRGAGKDGFIGVLSMCLLTPFNGIREYNVDICANNKNQAVTPVKDVVNVLENPVNTAHLRSLFHWTQEGVKCMSTKSELKGHAANAKMKDGLRSGIVILNEIHEYKNYDIINVFKTGLGKKQNPRIAYFTTNGNVREGPLDDLLEKSKKILDKGEKSDLLPFICKLDQKDEVDDHENWEKANPSLPYSKSLQKETEKEYMEWKENPTQLSSFMTKRMNLPQGNQDTEVTSWANILCTNRELPDLQGMCCTVGIDYSQSRDMTAVNLHFRDGDNRYDINHAWLNVRDNPDLHRLQVPWQEWADLTKWYGDPPLTVVDDGIISPKLIADYIRLMGEKYCIKGLAMDKFRFGLLKDELFEIGFDTQYRKNIKLVRPSDIMQVQPIIDSVFVRKNFTWGDNPVLRWATNNTKIMRSGKKEGFDTGNIVYAKIEAKSRKTDPFMALVASMVIEDKLDFSQREELELNVMVW